jgi:hypothetical protein
VDDRSADNEKRPALIKRSHLSFAEMRRLAAELFERHRTQTIPETTPRGITPALLSFANSLGGLPIVEVPVVPDPRFGLYCFCFDGVLEKVRHDGGGIRLGWAFWEWPNAFLNAEFHAVWGDPAGRLVDITPKPLGEKTILFAPDPTYADVSDLKCRPRNRRMRIYASADDRSEIARRIASMKPRQLAYERVRASKAGMTLEAWLASKMPADPWASAIDESIEACAALERKMEDFPAGVKVADAEVALLCDRREAAIRRLRSFSTSFDLRRNGGA